MEERMVYHMLPSSNIKMFVRETIPLNKDLQRPETLIFCHGFPEISYSWLQQMRYLTKNYNFHCIAPDQRGYGYTAATSPNNIDKYSFKYITQDLNDLLDIYKIKKAIFIGHDFGGSVVWSQVLHHKHRCIGIVSINTPLRLYNYKMRDFWRSKNCKGFIDYASKCLSSEQAGQIDYVCYYQIKGLADKELYKNVRKTMLAFFRSQSSLDPVENKKNARKGMRTVRCRKNNNRGVLYYVDDNIERDSFWSEGDIQMYVDAFERNGFSKPLNWYRNMDVNSNWDLDCGITDKYIINVPCLMVSAKNDLVLTPSQAKKMNKNFKNITNVLLECGHWTMKEKKDELNAVLADWLINTDFNNNIQSKL
eukprot:183627_1